MVRGLPTGTLPVRGLPIPIGRLTGQNLDLMMVPMPPTLQVEGITLDIMRMALAQAGEGRRHILGEMAKCSPPPQGGLSKHAPKVVRIKVRQIWI